MKVTKSVAPDKFTSPVPFLLRLRNLLLGKQRPDVYTRITFYIHLIIWAVFILWNITGYIAIASRSLIFSEKGIPVETIIQQRGAELGFLPEEFINRLMTLYGIGTFCWVGVFIGILFLYRKKHQFLYITLGSILFYLGMTIFYLSFTFFMEDTTTFDKIALLVLIMSTLLHSFMIRNENNGGSISFFGEADDDE